MAPLQLSPIAWEAILECYCEYATGVDGTLTEEANGLPEREGQQPVSRAVFKASANAMMRSCATNGIGMTVQEAPSLTEIQLDGVLYSEGFNRETFSRASTP